MIDKAGIYRFINKLVLSIKYKQVKAKRVENIRNKQYKKVN